ncbi:MAG: alpha/beta hydrolase [Acidobacteriota bacterium]|nr:alpha/beta hydrolase [Acidobacteriota bacterium]
MRPIVLAIFFSLFFLSTTPANGKEPPEPPGGKPASTVQFVPYSIVSPWGVAVVPARLGRLAVPENRATGSPRTISLAFVRIPTTARRPGSPIVWLAGGPGWSGTADLETPLLRLLLELRVLGDVIVLDQRGTGLSSPRLDCPGRIDFPRDVPLDRPRALAGLEAGAKTCAEHWRSRGVDLSAYNTRESAEDLEDLRQALGADRLRLLAGSYGTHLALAAIRAHGARIENAALIGVVGPDHLRRVPSSTERQLEEIARLVSRDPGLAPRILDLKGLVRRVRDRLDSHPVTVDLETREAGRVSVAIGKFDMEWYARGLLSSRETIARLPAVSAAMDAGDFRELGAAALAWRSSPIPPAPVFTMRCASGASRDRAARIAAEREGAILGDAADLAEERICRAWGIEPLPENFRSPVVSDVPALFVSGTLDGDTPEANADEVAPGFRNGSRLVIEGGAHGLLALEDRAARGALLRFFETGRARPQRLPMSALAFETVPSPRPALLAGGVSASLALFGGNP